MKSKPNPPRRHHYAPAFYLRQWSDSEGFLEQFSRPGGREVKPRRVAPSATGYCDDLYAMPGLPDHLVQQVEEGFMQEVDAQAAEVLQVLSSDRRLLWTPSTRSAWTRFIQSLQLRTPEDIVGIKQRTHADWGRSIPLIQETYDSLRRVGDPATFEEFCTRADPLIVERAAMRIATALIDNPAMGARINNMVWAVLKLDDSNLELLTSDRAVEQTLGLSNPKAFITLPIAPRRLFIAANERETIEHIGSVPHRRVVQLRNSSTVAFAREFVWSTNRVQTKYISDNLGRTNIPTLGERLAAQADQGQ